MQYEDLLNEIRHAVNRELKLSGFPTRDRQRPAYLDAPDKPKVGIKTLALRNEIFNDSVAGALTQLTTESSEREIRRVTRSVVRKIIRDKNREQAATFEETDELDGDAPFVKVWNGMFPRSSLSDGVTDEPTVSQVEDEIICYIEAKRRLARFIQSVGVERWRWYWNCYLNGYSESERNKFYRTRENFEKFMRREWDRY